MVIIITVIVITLIVLTLLTIGLSSARQRNYSLRGLGRKVTHCRISPERIVQSRLAWWNAAEAIKGVSLLLHPNVASVEEVQSLCLGGNPHRGVDLYS